MCEFAKKHKLKLRDNWQSLEFWTLHEASYYLKVSPSTLSSKVQKKELTHYKFGGLKFRKEDIDRHVEYQAVPSNEDYIRKNKDK